MNNLDKLIEILKDTSLVYIQMHNSPDPDSIASAFGLQKIFEYYGINSKICYKGEIEKYNTVRMIEELSIEITHINNISEMVESDPIVLVDSQKGNANITDFIGDEIASIDHHPTYKNIDYKYKDIRPNVGACASIIAEYYQKNNIPMEEKVATALLYGIKMDTMDLSRGVSELDLDMFYMLYKMANLKLISSIQINTLEMSDLIAYSNALKSIKIYKNIGFAFAGTDCPDSLLGTVSDFILALKEVEFAIVYSYRKNGIKFSVRNEVAELDAGEIISKSLKGLGSGGGHKSMAGGFIPIENMDSVYEEWESFLENRIIEQINISLLED